MRCGGVTLVRVCVVVDRSSSSCAARARCARVVRLQNVNVSVASASSPTRARHWTCSCSWHRALVRRCFIALATSTTSYTLTFDVQHALARSQSSAKAQCRMAAASRARVHCIVHTPFFFVVCSYSHVHACRSMLASLSFDHQLPYHDAYCANHVSAAPCMPGLHAAGVLVLVINISDGRPSARYAHF